MSIIVKSGVPGKIPTINQLVYGQLAINYADQRLYYKNNQNQIINIHTITSDGLVSPSNRFTLTKTDNLDFSITSKRAGSTATNTYQSGITYKVPSGETLAGIVFSNNNTDGTAIGFFCTNNYTAGPLLRAWILPNGDIGNSGNISSTNITASGTIAATGAITTSSTITASGNITGYSDIRLKKNLAIIQNAVDKIKSLTGYTYTRIDSEEKQTGLIAQDVYKVLPEAVQNGEYLSLAYGNMMGLIVEAIKELDNRISVIERKLL